MLTLISVLSLEDRQTLAYMLTHSLNSSPSPFHPVPSKTKNKKITTTTTTSSSSPCFNCCCFDCFSSFWNRWDSSPHRQLIDQAIEAFEEHLANADVDVELEEEVLLSEVEGRESGAQQQPHKGLARKVLPDVIGLFNSRLWNLWGPNI